MTDQMNSGMRIQDMPAERMFTSVPTKLIAPISDAIVSRWSERIHRSTPWPGLKSFSEGGGYIVQLADAGPPLARKLMYRVMPPNRKSQYESAFRRGKAMSLAPIISGTR